MKREIKFRAWHEGYAGTAPPVMLYDEQPGDCLYFQKQGQPVHVMQYTGLKDKNGKEIYEGDIVELDVTFEKEFLPFPDDESEDIHHEGTFKVYWNTENACFDLTKITGNNNGWFLQESQSELEVIGNIYANPELLKP